MSQNAPLPPPESVPVTAVGNPAQVKDAPLTGRDWVAVLLAGAVLLLVAIISAVLLLDWHVPAPVLQNIPPEQQKEVIEQYKNLTGVLGERTEKMFDLMVTKALLPLFATLVGFLLGKRSRGD